MTKTMNGWTKTKTKTNNGRGGTLTTVWSGPRLDKGPEWQQSKAKERLYAWNFTPAGGLSWVTARVTSWNLFWTALTSKQKWTGEKGRPKYIKLILWDSSLPDDKLCQVSQVFLPLQRTKRHFSGIAGAQKWQKSTGVSQSFGKTDKRIGWIEQCQHQVCNFKAKLT